MAKLHELIFESDLFKLNEEYIGQIVKECALPKLPESEEFSGSALWMALTSGSLKQQAALAEKLKAYVFAGKTAVVWYRFDQARENLLTSELDLEVFLPDLHKLVAKEPVLVGGIQLEEGQYLLRFMVKTGTNRRICGTGVTSEPKTALITTLISTAGNYIEVRCESKLADKIIDCIREKYVRDPKAIVKVDRYSDADINLLVRDLDGKLIEASSHPEILVNDMKPKHVEAVSEVLEAIDRYFHTADSQALMTKLENVRKICGTTSAAPFVVLVLAGMDKISMGTKKEKDLRNQALYKILQPYVKQLGGFITFPVVENQIAKEYTIRIGATTKSIGFATNATEKVIAAVRNKILHLDE